MSCCTVHMYLNSTFYTAADESSELEDGLIWPPTPQALAANPVLAHALRRAAKHARSELQLRVNQALGRPTRQVISRNDLERLQGQHIAKELLQCDMHVSNNHAQNLHTLWQVIEQNQPSVPPKQQPSVEHSRIAVEPAASDTAQTSDIQAERSVYAKIANPLEIANMLVAAKADDVCILDVASQCSFTEHMVLATGRSHRHIQAAAAAVAYQMTLRCSEVAPGSRPSVEGADGSDWCVVDAGSVIIHVFSGEARGRCRPFGLMFQAFNGRAPPGQANRVWIPVLIIKCADLQLLDSDNM
ncbi:hypothetical protein ABBQ32_001052 [Trebouxia sp. C0010 RCD-2024]